MNNVDPTTENNVLYLVYVTNSVWDCALLDLNATHELELWKKVEKIRQKKDKALVQLSIEETVSI